MAKIVRYNGNLQAFASAAVGTERTLFGEVTQADDLTSQITADFLRGWGIVGPSDQPALEDFNAVSYTLSQLLAYIHQVGVAEYNASQEYYTGSFCGSSGMLYVSLTDGNIGNTPASSPLSWRAFSGTGRLLRTSVYRNNGGTLQLSVDGAAFANSGSTFAPLALTASVIVQTLGGGGGGGGAAPTGAGQTSNGSGGGAGGYAKSKITSGFSGVSISVGAGGAAGAGVAGGNGGTSSFGALLSSAGGQGGPLGVALPATTTAPVGQSNGGTSTGGNMINSTGSTGKSAFYSANNISGAGGDSVFGGGAPFVSGTSSGQAAVSPGCGGSGGALSASSGSPAGGGVGFYGLVIIEEYE